MNNNEITKEKMIKTALEDPIQNIFSALSEERQARVISLLRRIQRIVSDWEELRDGGFLPQNNEIPTDILNRMKSILEDNFSSTEFTLASQL